MIPHRVAAVLSSVVLLLGACGDPLQPEGGDAVPVVPADDAEQAGDDGDDASAGRSPLLQVASVGGFVLAGQDFRQPPSLTVYPDGTAVVEGPQIAIFPPPALANLQLHTLADQQVDALVAAAGDAGLLGSAPEYGTPPIADAPTTVVTLNTPDGTVTHEVPALGLAEGLPGEPAPTELSEEALQARAALSGFLETARELVTNAGPGSSYTASAYAVQARPADPAAAPADPGGVEPSTLPWPLTDVPLADAGGCVLVEGDQAAVLTDTLAQASAITQYEDAGAVYDVWARPLLPGEDSCPPLG